MNTFYVTFAGHRRIDEDYFEISDILEKIILDILKTKEFVEFYLSADGDFDILATSAIRRARKRLGEENSALNLVLPYKKANLDLLAVQFDSVIIPKELDGVHYKKAIVEKNHWLVDNSDLVICYVKDSFGGAFNTLKYAKTNGKTIFNIFDEIEQKKKHGLYS